MLYEVLFFILQKQNSHEMSPESTVINLDNARLNLFQCKVNKNTVISENRYQRNMWLHKLLLFLLFSCICAEDIFQQIYHQFGKLLEESLPKNPNISIECKSILSTYSHGLQKDEKWTIKCW